MMMWVTQDKAKQNRVLMSYTELTVDKYSARGVVLSL